MRVLRSRRRGFGRARWGMIATRHSWAVALHNLRVKTDLALADLRSRGVLRVATIAAPGACQNSVRCHFLRAAPANRGRAGFGQKHPGVPAGGVFRGAAHGLLSRWSLLDRPRRYGSARRLQRGDLDVLAVHESPRQRSRNTTWWLCGTQAGRSLVPVRRAMARGRRGGGRPTRHC